MSQRLQVIIAKAGITSRRKAKLMIQEGRVKVNNRVVREPGMQVDLARDTIRVDGKIIQNLEPKLTIILNKPKGVITTLSDPQGRVTIKDILPRFKQRLFPIGRLDYHTEGAILLTNDGELCHMLQHPRYGLKKVYLVKVKGKPSESDLDRLRRGIFIDGRKTTSAKVRRMDKKGTHTWLEISIREGRNRQIRRMCQAIGHPVLKLKRIQVGPLSIGKLKPGEFRVLTRHEIDRLKSEAKNGQFLKRS